MTVLSASATAGLVLKAKADTTTFPGGAGALKTGTATIGDATATLYPDADVGYVVEITADDALDEANIAIADATFTQTTGSPVFNPESAKDFSGEAIPVMDRLYALRITAASGNASNVECIGMLDATIPPGSSVMIRHDADGNLNVIASQSVTFATAGDSVTVEIIARATPA